MTDEPFQAAQKWLRNSRRRTFSGPWPAKSAFTQVEMLTLLCGLAMLFLTLVPALGQARYKADRISCVENLHRIGTAIRQFAANHQDRNPTQVPVREGGAADYLSGATGGGGDLWRHYWVLSNELVEPRVLICPADSARSLATNFAQMAAPLRFGNQCMSYGVGTGADSSKPRMVLAADRSINWPQGVVTFSYGSSFALRGNIGTNAARLATMEWDQKAMHEAAGNALREDGSVQQLTSARLREAWANSGDSRNNYAQQGLSTR